tara:strand:+ start:174 stop:407 length:234 start_codon:yes stop_codon:yes gene_type:complete
MEVVAIIFILIVLAAVFVFIINFKEISLNLTRRTRGLLMSYTQTFIINPIHAIANILELLIELIFKDKSDGKKNKLK